MIDPNALDGLPDSLRASVVRELSLGYKMDLVAGQIHQQKIGAENIPKRRAIEGVGRLRMRIDPALYHDWGQKYGYGCWKDNGFLNMIERDNPEVRVNCGGTRIQTGYTGR